MVSNGIGEWIGDGAFDLLHSNARKIHVKKASSGHKAAHRIGSSEGSAVLPRECSGTLAASNSRKAIDQGRLIPIPFLLPTADCLLMIVLTGYFLRFATVGVLNSAVGYAVIFACMYALGMDAVTSNVVGYAVGLALSFVLNRTFTFGSVSAALPQALRFAAIFVLAYVANLGVLLALTKLLTVHEGLSQVIAGIAYFLLSFFLSKHYVFRPSSSGGPGDLDRN